MSPDELEQIKNSHEDNAVEELKTVLPFVRVDDIRRLLKEHGDGNVVLELLTGGHVEDRDPPLPESPNPTSETSSEQTTTTHQEETPLPAIEALSVEDKPLPSTPTIPDSAHEPSPPPKSPTPQPTPPKSKPREKKLQSAARKERLAKQLQKERAKQRRRLEAMQSRDLPSNNDDTTNRVIASDHVLKAIVV